MIRAGVAITLCLLTSSYCMVKAVEFGLAADIGCRRRHFGQE